MSNQYTYNYQQVPPDLEANKPPPYTSQFVYGAQPQPMAPPPQQYGWANDIGDQGPMLGPDDDAGISSFSEKSVRQAFIRKVYAILFCQLLVSVGIVCLFVLVQPINSYVKKNVAMFWMAWIATIVLMIAIACCENVRRTFPMNFIMLSLFTLCESYLIGVVSAHYNVNEVLLAMGIVAVVSLAITIFAFQTKYDFTMMGGFLLVLVIVLLCFGIFTIFFHSKIVRLVYACLGALIFGLYLVMDTQLMLGGQKKYSLSPEEYIFAALNLYIDIITLFLYILQIIGLSKN
ncbi:protein lifeguard 1 isoform X4 [Hydra vulgaris]|uniref:Protein lifeguard 1 isoform X4 n=1 Tax=Hydra vulgaris TaxID=6087 RepID=A0ABM4CST3_HYDVU